MRNGNEGLDGLPRARPDRFPGLDGGLDALDTASQARMERFEHRMPAREDEMAARERWMRGRER
jgi:hypothetical protein